MPDPTDPAITVCFVVAIDHTPIGTFTSCDGLGLEIAVEKREEGGNNEFVYQLPGHMSYTNIKLVRPINQDSSKVAQWMQKMARNVERHTATIQAMKTDGTVVCTWNLDRVIPVRWTGPQLSTDSPKVATETIELAHHGFVPGSN
jgi:phage tail-like protein